jgi:hypothetical protein
MVRMFTSRGFLDRAGTLAPGGRTGKSSRPPRRVCVRQRRLATSCGMRRGNHHELVARQELAEIPALLRQPDRVVAAPDLRDVSGPAAMPRRRPDPVAGADARARPSAPVLPRRPGRGDLGGHVRPRPRSVRHLSVAEAVEVLERSFPKRLAKRVRAFERADHRVGNPTVRRVRTILAGRRPVAVTGSLGAGKSRRCPTCSRKLPALARSDARYCSGRCRVSTHRARAA